MTNPELHQSDIGQLFGMLLFSKRSKREEMPHSPYPNRHTLILNHLDKVDGVK